MRIFKNKTFAKDASSARLSDEALAAAMNEVREGLVDAALGGDLYKKRIGVGGKGKRSGVRSLIAYRYANDRIFCLFVFPKNKTENITKNEEKQLKFLAKSFLKLNDKDLKNALDTGVLIEVPANDDEE
jgi:hypothetical protein